MGVAKAGQRKRIDDAPRRRRIGFSAIARVGLLLHQEHLVCDLKSNGPITARTYCRLDVINFTRTVPLTVVSKVKSPTYKITL